MSSGRVVTVKADDEAGQLVVDEHRAVAVVPVEGEQAVLADRLRRGELGEVLVQLDARVPRPRRRTARGTQFSTNHPNRSPTPLWPAS